MEKTKRAEMMFLRVSSEEKALIERHAKKEGMPASAYIRVAVLFDMVLAGDSEAIKHVASTISGKALAAVREKLYPYMDVSLTTVKG